MRTTNTQAKMKEELVLAALKEGKSGRVIAKGLHCSLRLVDMVRKQWLSNCEADHRIVKELIRVNFSQEELATLYENAIENWNEVKKHMELYFKSMKGKNHERGRRYLDSLGYIQDLLDEVKEIKG